MPSAIGSIPCDMVTTPSPALNTPSLKVPAPSLTFFSASDVPATRLQFVKKINIIKYLILFFKSF